MTYCFFCCLCLICLNLQVIRDVIGVHMEELSNHWQEESRLDNAEICEGGKSKSSGRYVTVGKFLRGVSSLIACNVTLLPLFNSTYQPRLRHIHSLFYTNSVKLLLEKLCLHEGWGKMNY